jgi:hypothetical protein
MAKVISSISNLCDIDRLGETKAQIADLQAVADGLAKSIKEMGAGKYDGELFSATVVKVDDRWSPDPKAIAAKLKELMGDKAFERFCEANQKKTSGYTSLTLNARD